MGILTDNPPDVGIQDVLAGRLVGKEGIQGVPERFLPAQQRGYTRHVMRDEEAVVPRGRLGIVPGTGQRVEGRRPGSVRVFAAHEAGCGVEDFPVATGAAVIFRGDVGMPQGFGHPGDAPVIVGELQRL